jgi:hypothetical protein
LTIRKLLLAAFSAAPIAECTVTAQDLDGTLKKIKDSSTLNLGYRESAPPFPFPVLIGDQSVTPSIFVRTSQARFRSNSGQISSSIRCL